MDLKKIGYGVFILGILFSIYIGYDIFFKQDKIEQVLIPEDQCNVETKTFYASDDYMSGLIENGQEFDVNLNWYKCHKVERGDIVLYRFSTVKDPVPRIVRALPGDRFKLVRGQGNWNIEINGDLLEYEDKPFHFGAENPPVLSLYEKSSGGLLDEDTVLIFSKNPPGGFDSGTFGALSIQDIIGKIDLNSIRAGQKKPAPQNVPIESVQEFKPATKPAVSPGPKKKQKSP